MNYCVIKHMPTGKYLYRKQHPEPFSLLNDINPKMIINKGVGDRIIENLKESKINSLNSFNTEEFKVVSINLVELN